jgi:hypothetical protein
VLFFHCHNCFISLFLNRQLWIPRICQYVFSSWRSLWLGCSKLYVERYPQFRLLNSCIFRTIDHLFRETRTVYPSLVGPIEDRCAQTVCEEQGILNCLEENPCTNICWIQAARHVTCMTVASSLWAVPVLILFVVGTSSCPLDFHPRQEICQLFLWQRVKEPVL